MVCFNARTFPIILLLSMLLLQACSAESVSNIPSDFFLVMDVRSAEAGSPNHINVEIDAEGKGRYEVYDNGGTIQYDLNDVVTYETNQVVDRGKFKLSPDELNQLWNAINENKFFELTENYQMAMGHSYAFIMIQANGKKHIVDNIGMEVPAVRALVEATEPLMPEGLDFDYGEGYKLQK